MLEGGIRSFGYSPGHLPCGPANGITDVPGIRVGHATIAEGEVQTGVTAILPPGEEWFRQKCPAASHIINGFGKSTGLIQIRELGTLETPILLTNTLSVGTALDALVKVMLQGNPEIGTTTGTVNAVVCECNDGPLNDIRGRHVTEAHVRAALEAARPDFSQGAVGAGRGMSCYGLKGGIGSASRTLSLGGDTFTLGVLALTNFGLLGELVIGGAPAGRILAGPGIPSEESTGSVILLIATDLPLSSRQLGRLCRRSQSGLARTGTVVAGGSGEIVIGFSTANRIPHRGEEIQAYRRVAEEKLDLPFRAVTEAVEEAVLNSMVYAEPVAGRGGTFRRSLADLLAPGGELEALREDFSW